MTYRQPIWGCQSFYSQRIKRLLLFPAWPLTWDVDFKLMAPENTTIEGCLRGGQVTELVVAPEDRFEDIVFAKELNYKRK